MNPQRWTRAIPRRAPAAMLLAGALGLALLLAGSCERHQTVVEAFPEPLTRADTCVVDGMILMEHPGPKGQIVLPGGERRHYCDTKELFAEWYDRDRTPKGAVAFVQPMDGREWGSHAEGWVRVDEARYVLGSPLAGAMGPTMVPFREEAAARGFIERQGGRLVAYDALDAEAVADYGREVRGMMRRGEVVHAGAPHGAAMHGGEAMSDDTNDAGAHDGGDPGTSGGAMTHGGEAMSDDTNDAGAGADPAENGE